MNSIDRCWQLWKVALKNGEVLQRWKVALKYGEVLAAMEVRTEVLSGNGNERM
jgi:hypothetical protein